MSLEKFFLPNAKKVNIYRRRNENYNILQDLIEQNIQSVNKNENSSLYDLKGSLSNS